LRDYYVYLDESGRPSDEYYVVTAVASSKELNLDDLLKSIKDRRLPKFVLSELKGKGEIKGQDLVAFLNKLPSNEKEYMINAIKDWIADLFTHANIVSIRSVVVHTPTYYRLINDSLTTAISTVIQAALEFRGSENSALEAIEEMLKRHYGILHYVSVLSIEDLMNWLLNLKVPRTDKRRKKKSQGKKMSQRPTYIQSLGFRLLRLQGLHEVIPKILKDIKELGIMDTSITIYADKEADGLDSASKAYLDRLKNIAQEGRGLPKELRDIKGISTNINKSDVLDSKCHKLKNNEAPLSACQDCNDPCPVGIWVSDIIAHLINKCVQGNRDACDILEGICEEIVKSRKKSFTVFAIPMEVREKVKESFEEYQCLSNKLWKVGVGDGRGRSPHW